MEQIIFYILIFCIGSVFGSFFTLAVYRIPLHQDITHERSYCPNCKHKLSFLDMIPILSYIFLKGKCRYCKNKIRIRYLLLEILTGIVFLLFGVSLKIKFNFIEINKIIYLAFSILYLAGIIIIAGIDKERHTIEKRVLAYEILVECTYMVYLCIVNKVNIYRYTIYLAILFIILLFEKKYLKNKRNYFIQILELSLIITIFSGEIVYIVSAFLTLIAIGIQAITRCLIKKSKNIKTESILIFKNSSIGFYLICFNIISLIIMNFKT